MEYQWNHANLLTAVIYKTSNNIVTKSVTYQYDALVRRVGKSVDDNGNGTVDRRESYIYDGAGLLATGERQGVSPPSASSAIHISGPNGSLGQHGWTDQMVLGFVDADGDGSGTAQLSGRYLYEPVVDEIFAVENGTGDVLWALTDQLGTPRDWAQRTTTGNTVIAQHIRYTAFGAIDSLTDSAGNPLAASASPLASFTGQLNDPDAGLIYYRARWYDPQLGKFVSDDPMGFEAGDANESRYAGNFATEQTDGTGLWSPEAHRRFLEEFAKLHPEYNLTPQQINAMVARGVGMDVSSNNRPELWPQHYLMPTGKTKEETIQLSEEFIRLRLIEAREKRISVETETDEKQKKKLEAAMRDSLAQALHTIMDSTSPVHNSNGWPIGYNPDEKGVHSGQEGVGKETVADITDEIMKNTLHDMEIAYKIYLGDMDPYVFPVHRP